MKRETDPLFFRDVARLRQLTNFSFVLTLRRRITCDVASRRTTLLRRVDAFYTLRRVVCCVMRITRGKSRDETAIKLWLVLFRAKSEYCRMIQRQLYVRETKISNTLCDFENIE